MTEECSIGDLFAQFYDYLIVDKRRAQNTIRAYKADLEGFLSDAKLSKDTKISTEQDYENLVDAIDKEVKRLNRRREYKPQTKNRKKVTANTFLAFLNKRVGVEVPRYVYKRMEQAPLTTLTIEQFDELMQCVPINRKFTSARDRAIYGIIFNIGIFQKEIAKVMYSDFVRWGDGEITALKVVYEGPKTRKIILADMVVKDLERYESLCQAADLEFPLNSEGIPYFRNNRRGPISDRSIRRKFHTHADKAGFEDIDLMSLRNSYIERKLKDGAKVAAIAESIGVDLQTIRKIHQHLPYFIAQNNK